MENRAQLAPAGPLRNGFDAMAAEWRRLACIAAAKEGLTGGRLLAGPPGDTGESRRGLRREFDNQLSGFVQEPK